MDLTGDVLKEDKSKFLFQLRSFVADAFYLFLLWNTEVHRDCVNCVIIMTLLLFKDSVSFLGVCICCACAYWTLRIFIPKTAIRACVYFNAFTTQIQDQCYN